MTERPLQDLLGQLRAELREGPPLDSGARQQLESLARDIERRLHPDRTEPEVLEALATNLREAIERFEETHPELTAAVNRVADALARLGI